MSISLMSAVFQTEFRDLQDSEGKVTKASTAKIVVLAMADHANDEGEGAYPSIESLAKKCALSEQTIRNTFDALLYNGIIYRVGTSKYMTHNHSINTKSFPSSKGRRDFPPIYIGVKPVEGQTGNEGGSNEYLKGVNPVDPNHPLTVLETSVVLNEEEIQQVNAKVDAIIAGGQNRDWTELLHDFERVFGFGSLPWYSTGAWEKFAKWIIKTGGAWFADYVIWRNGEGKYKAFSNKKIRENPAAFMDTGYPEYEASKMYRKTDETRPEYQAFPFAGDK